jgi:4,5-DOPA dioxygenase extradiol
MTTFPPVFVSHGSPMIMLEQTPARDFLTGFGQQLGRPKAILVASAHFESRAPLLSADVQPEMIYDFGGFPRPLFEMQYPAAGDPALAQRAAKMLGDAGLVAQPVTHRGFDHGTWVPLKLMYPDADIPVVQISLQPNMSAQHHIAMGRALAPLREEGVLIIGSGSLTHNLYELRRAGGDMPPPEWVSGFADWTHEALSQGHSDKIAAWASEAPFARENHPSPEHFLPLPFAYGAAGERAKGRRVHTSCEYGVLMMDAYVFG